MPQDSLGGYESERHHTTDGRRCVLCSVKEDTEPMVNTMSAALVWPLLVLLFLVAGSVGGWAALALCCGRVGTCQLCSVVGRCVLGSCAVCTLPSAGA